MIVYIFPIEFGYINESKILIINDDNVQISLLDLIVNNVSNKNFNGSNLNYGTLKFLDKEVNIYECSEVNAFKKFAQSIFKSKSF